MCSISQNIFTIYFFYLSILSFILSANCSFVRNSSRPNEYNSLCNARPPRDLRYLNNKERRDFFESFDTVITDISALMRQSVSPRSTIDGLKKLQRCHKQIIYLVDDSIHTVQNYISALKIKFNYFAADNQFILPFDSLIWYLQKFRMNGKAYVIGTKQFQQKLRDIGMDIVTGPDYIHDNFYLDDNIMAIDKNVKAVIVEFDANMNWAKIVQAGLYLKNENIQFLAGTAHKYFYANKSQKFIGPGYFQEILANYSGRTPLNYGKPGRILRDSIIEHFPTIATSPERVLFIGNSLDIDMKFAYLCGFQKLWIDSSNANRSVVLRLEDNCETSSDYYLYDISKIPTC